MSAYNATMTSRNVIKRLKRDGWQLVRTKGDHHVFAHPDRHYPVVVPHPVKDIPIGTLRSIFRQAGWDWKDRT
jgi:predicted RNA binding protein YcfA (HicA-like mRNA interferase family)